LRPAEDWAWWGRGHLQAQGGSRSGSRRLSVKAAPSALLFSLSLWEERRGEWNDQGERGLHFLGWRGRHGR